MARDAIEQVLYSLDAAFEGGHHSLLANLATVPAADWTRAPEGGSRTILAITRHVGESKYAYENHAWGDRSMRWDRPETVPTIADDASPYEAVEWLREAHRRLRARLEAMADDAELTRPRMANWGREYETRWLLQVMVEHDLYHAGEINHIRALLAGRDRWAWEQAP